MTASSIVEIDLPGAREIAGKVFPVAFGPAGPPDPASGGPASGAGRSIETLLDWITGNRDEIFDRARDHGAVLLRGFEVATADDFARVVDALELDNMPYVGGAAVRNRVAGDRVLTANESPPSEPIPFHHEMSQVPEPPHYVVFCCDVPAAEGGETPILLSNQVYQLARERHPEFMQRVEQLGVRYRRIMPTEDDPSSAIGRSWKSTYQASTREQAEARMREQQTSWTWLDNGDLETITTALPAIRTEPRTGRKTFFNSMIAAYTGWVDRRNDPTRAVQLGDGSPVDHQAMVDIAEIMARHRVAFAWRKSDVLLVDNRLTMHSRNPFVPPRRILASVARARRA